MPADVRIRWHLELVGDPSRQVLKQDRAIRSSLTATDRAQRKLATAASSTGRAQQRAGALASTALKREGRAARSTASDVSQLNRAQAQALTSGNRIAASARRVADAYRTQARSAHALSLAERGRARAQRAAARAPALGAGLAAAAGRVGTGIAAAGAGVGVFAGVRAFAGFEQQMDRVQAVSGASERQMVRLERQAERLGAKTSFSAREAADGMYQLSTAGFKTTEVIRTIPGVLDLAAASGVGLADAAELQASALRGFGLRAGEAGRVADVLATTVNRSAVEMYDLQESLKYVAPVARATGQSLEEMLAAIGLMGNVGIKGSQAGTTLRTALVRLTDPTEKAQGALSDLGIQANELRGPKGLLPLPQILDKVVRGAQDLDKGTRNAALSRIFGREALSGMVALVEQGPRALNANIKALRTADGEAKRTAKTMRENVAGGWDEFTGSLETAAITLTKRFGPALREGLRGTAALTNRAARRGGDFLAGVTGSARARKITRGPGGRVESVSVRPDSAARTLGADVADGARSVISAVTPIAKTIGNAAMSAGRQLLDAFKPALPFFQNVLLPLLKGVGKGVLVSLVGAFKVVVGVIRIVSTGLGWLGEKAKPLRGVFEGIGTVIGFVFGGPILKGIALLGKLGGALKYVGPLFSLLGVAAKITVLPIRLLGVAVGGIIRLGGSLVTRLAGPARAAFGFLGRAASGAADIVRGVVGRITGAASGIVRGLKRGLAPVVTNVYSIFRGAFDRALDFLKGGGLAGTFFRAGKSLVSKLVDGVKGIGLQIKRAFGSGIAFAGDIGRALADWLNRTTPLGNRVNLPSPLPDFTLPSLRRGGRLRRYQAGGAIAAAVSPGELVEHQGRSWVVPGRAAAADSVLTALPVGARVYTADGQARLAAGESPETALRNQLPHFARGGRVRGLIPDAFEQGYGAGAEGLTRAGIRRHGNPIIAAIREATAQRRERSRRSSSTSSTAPTGSGGPWSRTSTMAWATGFARRHSLGISSSWRSVAHNRAVGGVDGSLHTHGTPANPGAFDFTPPKASALADARSMSPPPREAMIHDAGSGLHLHVGLFRRGGRAGFGARGAGRALNRGANRALSNAGGSLAALDELLGRATMTRIEALRAAIAKRAQGDAPAKTIKRLQAMLSTLDFEIGRRVGRIVDRVASRGARAERTVASHGRVLRMAGIAPESSAGIASAIGSASQVTIPAARANVRALERAQAIARRRGDRGTLRAVTEQLLEAQGALEEELVTQLERRRELLRATAQDAVDTAEHGYGLAQSALATLDVSQRLSRSAGTPEGMRARAAAIHSTLLPALSARGGALEGQRATALATGDLAGARSAELAIVANATDLATALADAGDLIRDAALQAAQEVTDVAGHRATLATSGLRRLELEQRLAGTFEGGARARADYIKQTIVPAIEAEIAALQGQQQAAKEQGDEALARQIAEQIDGKIGDKLQSQLDAQEAIAENTEELKDFRTSLASDFAGMPTTDNLHDFGLGS